MKPLIFFVENRFCQNLTLLFVAGWLLKLNPLIFALGPILAPWLVQYIITGAVALFLTISNINKTRQ